MILRRDCTHFPGDRPCFPHKQTGVHCDTCDACDPIKDRIIIIKLDAVGDVLRTTCILPGLKEKYPTAEITWVTMSVAKEIFFSNPYVHRVLLYDDPGTSVTLAVEHFTLLINLDSSPKSAAMASFCHAKEKLGFGLDEQGKVFCFNTEAVTWFEMGAFDDLKKKNTHTYQDLMLQICRIQPKNFEIVLNLTDEERQRAEIFRRDHAISPSSVVIGINAGAGPRWERKKWTPEGYRELIRRLVAGENTAVVLYGGKGDRELNLVLSAGFTSGVFIARTENSLREFFSLLSISDIVVTGDTLALHAATALRKQVIAIFGPTSAVEVETYGRVHRVVSDTMECQCYYKPVCTQEINCMNTISADRVFALIRERLKAIQHTGVVSRDLHAQR
jgi:ADP-heptose:LPS heptosyltransferase